MTNETNLNESSMNDRKKLGAKRHLYYGDVLRLYVEEGRSAAETARRLGLSKNTVHEWIQAGGLDGLRRHHWYSSHNAALEIRLMLHQLIRKASVAAKFPPKSTETSRQSPGNVPAESQQSPSEIPATSQRNPSESSVNDTDSKEISLETLNKMVKLMTLIEKLEGLPMPLRSYTHFAPDLLKWCRENCADDRKLLTRMGDAVEGYGAELLEKT